MTNNHPPIPILPQALLFDMDGTLTRPLLDFALIKREMGIGEQPILETLAQMPLERRQAAEAILLRHEDHAADHSTLNEGCLALLAWLGARQIPMALITRNSRSCADRVLQRHTLEFHVVITREEGKYKPDPAPLLDACRRLGVACANAWMVGDGQYDIEAGQAAGAKTVWLSHGRARPFLAQPWQTVRDLLELTQLLKSCQTG